MSSDETKDAQPERDQAQQELRQVSDARTMRALAHPVRIALIEQLGLGGAMTATEVGELIGESPTTCSFHLRQLAKYGFVEEAGGGRGRARPWRISSFGMIISDIQDNPEAQFAANALIQMFRERVLGRYQAWLQTKPAYPRRWRDASVENQHIYYLTVEELEGLNEELTALMATRFPGRVTDPSKRPPGSVPVEMLMLAYPIGPPPPETDGEVQ